MSSDASVVAPSGVATSDAGVFPPIDGKVVCIETGEGQVVGHGLVGQSDPETDRSWIVVAPANATERVWCGLVNGSDIKYVIDAPEPEWFGPARRVLEALLCSSRLVHETRDVHASQIATLHQHHRQWIDQLVDDAHEYANDNSLCSEFDRFMTEHNLPARQRDFCVSVDVMVRVKVDLTITAEDSDSVDGEVDSDLVESAVRSELGGHGSFDVTDWDVTAVEEN
ncbi:hypothetical protein GS896_25830 [Rhodococcus hoagii]|nr:hypothetical protein [Prescottella equi]NKR23346.1 hypothetical protein [Prescottella equi]NKT56043.1 hypothetical protein [Prescottella equi]